MCALLIMAVHDTKENKRSNYTRRTLESLLVTVDLNIHRLFISDNGSCQETQAIYLDFMDSVLKKYSTESVTIHFNNENLGTALAVNKGIATRKEDEYVIKMDNDVVFYQSAWVDLMEEAMRRDDKMGVLGLKRKDLEQRPGHDNVSYRTKLIMLPHEKGERWIIIEKSEDVMGTCVMHSPHLLDVVGGLFQPATYGFDDVLMCIRSREAGFYNAFLPHIVIDHIDVGGDAYCDWKTKHSGAQWDEFNKIVVEYRKGTRPLYYKPEP